MKDLPSLMSIPTQTFRGGNQQHHYRPNNPRFMENNGMRSRFPSPGSHIPTSAEPFNNQQLNPSSWTNNDRNSYPAPPQIIHPNNNEQQQQVLTSQLFQKHQLIPVVYKI